MKAATVVGSGELGRACALALAADGVAAVRLLSRDVALAPTHDTATSTREAAGPASAPSRRPSASSVWPSAIRLCDMQKTTTSDAAAADHAHHPLFICTPVTAYLSPEDAWATAALGKEHRPVAHDVLQHWRRAVGASSSSSVEPARRAAPFVCAFTRGFTADGLVPAQAVDELLNSEAACRTGSEAIPVLVAAGPLLAKEWAQQCTPLTRGVGEKDAFSSQSASSSIPPRPRSALMDGDGNVKAADPDKTVTGQKGLSTKNAAGEVAISYPHAFSGASLTFATWTPSVHADVGRQDFLSSMLEKTFQRESVMFLREADAAAVLSIVNGCVPLCAFGAGLVSSVYTGASVTALASYAQHATVATEQLVNRLLGRPKGTPLPIAAWSTLHCACTSLASREFALGRQLDFYFRKQDAAQAIFRGRTHQIFAATVDGLHTRMQASGAPSPFYEVLMDTYNTMIRASQAGEGLVKTGYYDYRGVAQDEGALLRHAMEVDNAMLSGDEDRFTAAKEHFVRAFPGAVIQ